MKSIRLDLINSNWSDERTPRLQEPETLKNALYVIGGFNFFFSGPAGGSEGLPAEGDGGAAEADGGQQRHPEPAALPHAEGEG